MSEEVNRSTTAARNNAVSAVKMSGKTRHAYEFLNAGINDLADAINDLDARIDSITRAINGHGEQSRPARRGRHGTLSSIRAIMNPLDYVRAEIAG